MGLDPRRREELQRARRATLKTLGPNALFAGVAVAVLALIQLGLAPPIWLVLGLGFFAVFGAVSDLLALLHCRWRLGPDRG